MRERRGSAAALTPVLKRAALRREGGHRVRTVLCALNAKYVHASLAPWCLAAGVAQHAPTLAPDTCVVEGTINEPEAVVLARILAQKPDVACFSCYLWNIAETLRLAASLRAAPGRVTVVLGGPEVSYNAAELLQKNAQVDYILSGEGEESLPALLRSLAAGEAPQNIPGLCTRQHISEPCVLRGVPADPYTPAYFARLGGRIAYLETSRGCPYTCAFCLSGRCGRPRWFPLERACGDLLALARSGARTIKFVDRTFNANPAHADAILAFILEHYGREIPAGARFHFEIAGDILRETTFALLARMPAGAVQLEIGLQSFCPETLAAVRRKTDTALLQRNIRRLTAQGNLHVHIDLIAGLPLEGLESFARSFDAAYALGADMLQLGFLKLLHGAPMREEAERFPCAFSPLPPYEVQSTPWLSAQDLALLHKTEDALERVYNSGRFRTAAAYVLECTGTAPFAFYTALGQSVPALAGTPLDRYTGAFYAFCARLPGVEGARLRDALVCDRLATNATGRLPACLQVRDAALARAVRALAQRFPAQPGVRRGVALLYGAHEAAFVDYTQKNPVTGRYLVRRCGIDKLLGE